MSKTREFLDVFVMQVRIGNSVAYSARYAYSFVFGELP